MAGALSAPASSMLIERAEGHRRARSAKPYAAGLFAGHDAAALATTTCSAGSALALEAGDRAEAIPARLQRRAAWELAANARMFALFGLVHLGRRARPLSPPAALRAREAAERGDVYADVQFRVGHPTLRWLVQDDPAGGRADVEDAMAIWSKRSFQTGALLRSSSPATKHRPLHRRQRRRARGQDPRALGWRSKGSLLVLVQAVRIQARQSRARTSIALAGETGDRALLRSAARDARSLEREHMAWSTAMAKLLRAGIERTGGNADRTVAHLRDAMAGFAAADMVVYEQATRRALGGVLAGDEGSALVKGADAWFAKEGVKSPAKMTAMMAPGFVRTK